MGNMGNVEDVRGLSRGIVDHVSECVDATMRANYGERVLTPEDLPVIRELFRTIVVARTGELGLVLPDEHVQNVVNAYADSVKPDRPGPWTLNVIDFRKYYERRVIERGEGGYFADCPDELGDMLTQLSLDKAGPFAIGLLKPNDPRTPDEPVMLGWAFSPEQARALGRMLLEKADACERGWP